MPPSLPLPFFLVLCAAQSLGGLGRLPLGHLALDISGGKVAGSRRLARAVISDIDHPSAVASVSSRREQALPNDYSRGRPRGEGWRSDQALMSQAIALCSRVINARDSHPPRKVEGVVSAGSAGRPARIAGLWQWPSVKYVTLPLPISRV